MSSLPVIIRELRAEARRPSNYWLRVLGATALLMALWLAFRQAEEAQRFPIIIQRISGPVVVKVSGPPSLPVFGAAFFGYCNAALFAGLWILVPLLTADCLSRERREGTLGLLFLTPLSARGVVVGKSLVHGLRALTLYFTVLPLLAVPLLFGGVSVNDLVMAALLDSSALVLALSAGLLASCLARDRMKVILLAEVFSLLLAVPLMNAHQTIFEWSAQRHPPLAAATTASLPGLGTPFGPWPTAVSFYRTGLRDEGVLFWLERLFSHSTNWLPEGYGSTLWGSRSAAPGGAWSAARASYPAAMHTSWFLGVGALLACSLGWLTLAIVLAARRIRESWREEGPSRELEELRQTYCTPLVFRGWLRHRLSHALQHNPVGWLAQYSWQARLTKWGWCLFVVLVEIALTSNLNDFSNGQPYIAGLLTVGMAFSAALGFRRELESHFLELLLVTPVRPLQIVRGRIRALWGQFLPAVSVLLFANYYAGWEETRWTALALTTCWAFAAVPVFGLFFSFFRWNLMAAWLATCVCGLIPPWLASRAHGIDLVGPVLGLMMVHGGMASIAWVLVAYRLAKRRFAFS